MDDQILVERVVEIESQCKQIKSSLGSIQVYLMFQLIIVISYISLPWLYQFQKESICYLIWRLLQYLFHLFSVIRITKTVEEFSDPIVQRSLIVQLNDQINVWATVMGNHGGLSKCNEFVYVIMFGYGNVVLLQNTLLICKWILVVQLILGWIVLATFTFLFLAVCLIVPYLIYRTNRQRREEERRRQVAADGLISKQIKYSELNLQPFQPCYICLQPFSNDDQIIQLNCNENHIFHSDCICKWVVINDSCPVCRQRLQQQ